MKEPTRYRVIVFIFLGIHFGLFSEAEEAKPLPNPILQERAELIAKQSMRVLSETEGVVSLSLLKNGQSLVSKTLILFFRRKKSRVEVIANGVVSGEKKNPKTGVAEILVDIDRDTIVKYPQAGDFAIPMSDPNATAEGDKKDQFDYLVPEETQEKIPNDRPGYLEGALGLMQGTMKSSPANGATADSDKNPVPGYRFLDTHFAYYSEFFPVGVEYDSYGGNFPTGTYYHSSVSSSERVSLFTLGYRIKPFFHQHLNAMLKVNSLSDQFTTDNPDEHVLSTKTTGFGYGLKLGWEFVSPVWKPEHANIGLTLQRVYGEYSYFPSITATDGAVSRGTSSTGSNGSSYRAGLTALGYLGFIPVVKRFVFDASYGMRSYNLKFQGQTAAEFGLVGGLPQNGTSKISEGDFRFFFGIRFDDPLKFLFSGDDKKKDAKR